jgi:S1-C subfamily serine protease
MNTSARQLAGLLTLATLCVPPQSGHAENETSIASSVVSFNVLSDAPDLTIPWQTEGIEHLGGSGVIIDGRRILTNAHVVESAVSIEVKRADGKEPFTAKVTFISHDADLALVEVEDPRFFDGAIAMPIGEMPKLQQTVLVYGFPIGGFTMSITSGIVSRVEIDTYAQSNRRLLSVQIDAALNEGNSGGPVVTDGAIVGIAMQGFEGADNVGYMIPSPVIRHFLADVADGRYDGVPRLGIDVQDMESQSQRRARGMTAQQSGALVTRVDYEGPSYGTLRPRDVLLSIDGHVIANDLTVSWPGIGRVDYELVFESKQIGESISVTFLRRGKTLTKTTKLEAHTPLVPGRRTTEWPRYLQFAGLVFQPLSDDMLDAPGAQDDAYPDSYSYSEVNNLVTKERREIILLGQVLPHAVNRGYQDWGGETIRLVNGIVPQDLQHLAAIIDGASGPWLRIVTGDGWLLTLDLEAARKANPEILMEYGILHDRYLGTDSSGSRTRRGRH